MLLLSGFAIDVTPAALGLASRLACIISRPIRRAADKKDQAKHLPEPDGDHAFDGWLSVQRCHLLGRLFLQIETMLKVHAHMPRNTQEIVVLLILITEPRGLVAQFRQGMGDRSFDLIFFGIVQHRPRIAGKC